MYLGPAWHWTCWLFSWFHKKEETKSKLWADIWDSPVASLHFSFFCCFPQMTLLSLSSKPLRCLTSEPALGSASPLPGAFASHWCHVARMLSYPDLCSYHLSFQLLGYLTGPEGAGTVVEVSVWMYLGDLGEDWITYCGWASKSI